MYVFAWIFLCYKLNLEKQLKIYTNSVEIVYVWLKISISNETIEDIYKYYNIGHSHFSLVYQKIRTSFHSLFLIYTKFIRSKDFKSTIEILWFESVIHDSFFQVSKHTNFLTNPTESNLKLKTRTTIINSIENNLK